jgi:hypothetical protein
MFVLANAFSLKMLDRSLHEIIVEPLTMKDVRKLLRTNPWISVVGHESTANLFTKILGIPVPCVRGSYVIAPGDKLIVGLLGNGRLPEGKVLTDEELKGIEIDWRLVRWA